MAEAIFIFASVYAASVFPRVCHRLIIFLRIRCASLERRRSARKFNLGCSLQCGEAQYAFLRKK